MLIDIYLLEPFQGVSAGQCTQVQSEIAETLIEKGLAKKIGIEKETKTETKKLGK